MDILSPEGLPRVALIAGPTASGKSAHAMRLAEGTGGIVINADSAQVYRDLRILSARPTEAEEAHVPHRLFGHIDGAAPCSAAAWAADAAAAIDEAHGAGRLPILVGGTGLYLRTLLDGIAPIPEIEPGIRAEVRALPVEAARACLEVEDPTAAAALAPRDTARIARALEVVRQTGRSILAWRAERTGGIAGRIALEPLVMDPPVDWLYARCDARFDAMLAEGGIDEARALLDRGLESHLPVMRAIGVPPLIAYLRGETTLGEAAERARKETRNYAKRQRTWFRHQAPATWPRHDGSGGR